MKELNKSLDAVMYELNEVGLFSGEFQYLYQINIIRSPLPSWIMENGMVIDEELDWFNGGLLGFEEGEIYISKYPSLNKKVGNTLRDLIRHEYGHAWAWLDKDLFKAKWFKEAFGNSYWSIKGKDTNYFEYYWKDARDGEFKTTHLYDNYVSEYALFNPAEDFAETFMFFLKYRNSLERFKMRKGVFRKLRAIEKATRKISDIQLIRY